jgi:hypothetical protein
VVVALTVEAQVVVFLAPGVQIGNESPGVQIGIAPPSPPLSSSHFSVVLQSASGALVVLHKNSSNSKSSRHTSVVLHATSVVLHAPAAVVLQAPAAVVLQAPAAVVLHATSVVLQAEAVVLQDGAAEHFESFFAGLDTVTVNHTNSQ